MSSVSRLHLFVRGVASGYVSIGAMIVFSLLSVPLALHYLSKEAFGLWALLTQIVSYLMLIDFGLTPSVSRLLIERKDSKESGAYARIVNSAILATILQGALVVMVGFVAAPWLSRLFKIPAESHELFCRLVRWQSVIIGVSFATRIFRNLLFAHQRNDLVNISQAMSSLVGLGVLALWLRLGHGVMSIIWSNACALAFIVAVNGWLCARLGLFPKSVVGSRLAWDEFRELFVYGRDVFLAQVGSLLIITTQPMVISRTLGLEAVAVWSVGVKAFFMISNLIWQVFDMSGPAFVEMMVREESVRLRKRYREIVAFSLALSTVLAVIYAALNVPFVEFWSGGKVPWTFFNDVLLGAWMVISTLVHANSGFLVLMKRIEGLRYIFLLEGAAFVLFSSVLAPTWGFPGVIATSLLCSLVFSGAYSVYRINRHFGGFFTADRDWFGPPLRLVAPLLPVAFGFWWLTQSVSGLYRFIAGGCILSAAGGLLFLQYGVPMSLRPDLVRRVPESLRSRAEKWAFPLKQVL